MVIIQLAGGLGNQLFQYALYWQFRNFGREVKIDDRTGFLEDTQRKPVLSAFGLSYDRATEREIRRMLDSEPDLIHKVRRKLLGRNKRYYFEEDKRFHPEIFQWDNIYLEGYWQSERYFMQSGSQLREMYDTELWLKKEGAQEHPLLLQLEGTESVSVHIRRGDYLTPENEALFGGICTKEYYAAAMREMDEKYPGCRFFLFSNDPEGAAQLLQSAAQGIAGERITPVVLAEGEQRDLLEFALMSRCRHQILANSSFGWWASYLNKNPDKTVLVPDRWLNGWDCRDFYREDMRVAGRDAAFDGQGTPQEG